MDLNKNIKYLDFIRDKIDQYIAHNYSGNIKGSFIGDNLARACDDGKIFDVNFIKLQPGEKTFIMCCYPDYEELNQLSESLALNLHETDDKFRAVWNGIRRWHIEIDERLLKKGTPITVDNGSQFVAILCHELGHILNTFPLKLLWNYRMSEACSSMFYKLLMSDPGKFVVKLLLPIYVIGNSFRILISRPGHELEEIRADYMVPDQYKPFLIDYTKNHILTNAETASGIVMTHKDNDKEIKSGIQFSNQCIQLMKKRSTILSLHLESFGKLSPSKYIGEFCNFLVDAAIPNELRKQYVFMEGYQRAFEKAEGKVDAALESIKVTERDMMLLQIDIDSMKSLDDKTYVVNTICDYIEALEKEREKALKKCKDRKTMPPESLVDDRLPRLYKMKQEVMATKITTNDAPMASVYVKYPAGYEG